MNIKPIAVINPLLKEYIDYYYILSTADDQKASNYIAYPAINIPLCFLDQSAICISPNLTKVIKDEQQGLKSVIVGHSAKPVHISLQHGIQEFCITFKPLGINFLTNEKLGNHLKPGLRETNHFDFLKDIVKAILKNEGSIEQLEAMIIERIYQHKELQLLRQLISLITTNDIVSFKEITALLAVPYKNIYRLFNKHVGVSPAQFRRIIKFRAALNKGINPDYKNKMSTIALESGYFDQAHYINEFKKISNLTPKHFLSAVWFDPSKKVAWKLE